MVAPISTRLDKGTTASVCRMSAPGSQNTASASVVAMTPAVIQWRSLPG